MKKGFPLWLCAGLLALFLRSLGAAKARVVGHDIGLMVADAYAA